MLRLKARTNAIEQTICACLGLNLDQDWDFFDYGYKTGFHFTEQTSDGHTNGYYVGYIHGDGQGCPKLAFISEGESGNGYPKFSNQG